ncbi:hypothetical protein GCM10007170_01890 [Arthrobacter liuii]|uniref:Uncharacterized protein n=1 Tax=Arthrobacter liuii TaxID=1476996 RepID=A0ABQ2AD50_9MICC|nr:hypothetical protein GCM10007170_01890 [Arthrobacter liuii]
MRPPLVIPTLAAITPAARPSRRILARVAVALSVWGVLTATLRVLFRRRASRRKVAQAMPSTVRPIPRSRVRNAALVLNAMPVTNRTSTGRRGR